MRPAESVASSAVKTAFDTKAAMIGKRPLNIARLHLYVVVVLIRSCLSLYFRFSCTATVVLTETGTTARLIAKYRPSMPILAFTALEETARQCNGLLRNVSTKCIGSMIGVWCCRIDQI